MPWVQNLKSITRVCAPNLHEAKKNMSNASKERSLLFAASFFFGFAAGLLAIILLLTASFPKMKADWPVFSLNTTAIGVDINQQIDGKIAAFNLDDLHINLKRTVPSAAATPTIPPAPLITMAPRELLSDLENSVNSAKSSGKSRLSSAHSSITSAVSSAEGSVESSVNGALDRAADKIKSELTKRVDDTFADLKKQLGLKGFYNMHLVKMCWGDFDTSKGRDEKNITDCRDNSMLNPLWLLMWFYIVGVILPFLSTIFGFIFLGCNPYRKSPNRILFCISAAGSLSLITPSLLITGFGLGGAKLVNFLGQDVGVQANVGMKFLIMSWTAAACMVVNTLAVLFLTTGMFDKLRAPRDDNDAYD